MFICTSDQYPITILSGYLNVVEELAIRSHPHFGLGFQHAREPNRPPGLLTNCIIVGARAIRGNASILAAHRSYMFPFSASGIGRIDPSMLHSRCIALITMLGALLSERVEPGHVILHDKLMYNSLELSDKNIN